MASVTSIYYGDSITSIQDVDIIKESITRILMTSPGERLNEPDFGSRFKSFIFEQDLTLDGELQSEVYNSISRWEPRVDIVNITVTNIDQNSKNINIQFKVKNTGKPIALEFGFTQ